MKEISQYTKDSFSRGDDDLKVIEILLRENGVPNIVCFHAQQAVEKYLKGFLASHEKHARKIHSLELLLEACVTTDESFQELRREAQFLDHFYTETRYADDYIEYSKEDAKEAFDVAKRIKDFVLGKIKS